MIRKATCSCGKCSIEVEGEPFVNVVCNCNNCKKRTGSAFGWSAYFREDQILQKSGDLRVYEITGEKAQLRWFCSNCGSTLFWKGTFPTFLLRDYTGIACGCFADNPLEAPTFTANNHGRCAWLRLADECVDVDDREGAALFPKPDSTG